MSATPDRQATLNARAVYLVDPTTGLALPNNRPSITTVGHATPGTAAVPLVAANTNRAQLIVYNNDPAITVYISNDPVVTATAGSKRGMAIPPLGERVWLATTAVYIVAASGTPSISYQDDSY